MQGEFLDYLFWQTLSPYAISFLRLTCKSFSFSKRWFKLIWNEQTVPTQFHDPLDLERAAYHHLFYLRKPINLGLVLWPNKPNHFDAGPKGQIAYFNSAGFDGQIICWNIETKEEYSTTGTLLS